MRHQFFLLIALSLFTSNLHAAEAWKKLYEQDGVIVEQDTGEPLPKFRATGIINLNFYEMFAVLADIPRRLEWVENLAEIKTLRGDVLSRVVVYNRFDLPWPASDRDSIVAGEVSFNHQERSAVLNFRATQDQKAPEIDGVIRVKTVEGVTRLKFVDETHTAVSEEIIMDPGGYLPKWIAKLFIEDVPINTLKALKQQVTKTHSQYDEKIKALKAAPPQR